MTGYDDGSSSPQDPRDGQARGGAGLSDFQTLVGHALMDPTFRDQLTDMNTRAEAVKSITGREMTSELSEAIDNALAAINNLAVAFGEFKAAT